MSEKVEHTELPQRGTWRVERYDNDDGSIAYEIWQEGPVPEMIEFDDLTLEGYRRIGTFHELYDSKFAKKDAAYIVLACNSYPALLAERDRLREALEEIELLDEPATVDGDPANELPGRAIKVARAAIKDTNQ